MIERSMDRVAAHTAPHVQNQIERRIECDVHHFARHPDEIEQRLRELDREWDIERVLETNSALLSLYGLVRGLLGSWRWLLLPLTVQAFFLQHALQGWCPPIWLLRRVGVRTRDEIARERYALKALRGDFQGLEEVVEAPSMASRALSAVD